MSTTIPADLLGMYALTMSAPWGTAIARWGKGDENRDWRPWPAVLGQRIGIHQGGVPTRQDGSLSRNVAGDAISNTLLDLRGADLLPVTIEEAMRQVLADAGKLIGTAVVSDFVSVHDDHVSSCWANPGKRVDRSPWMITGGYAWTLTDRQVLDTPIALSGIQKLWTIGPERLPKGAHT